MSYLHLTYIGIACAVKGRYKAALPFFWNAYGHNQGDINARLNLANCLKDLGDFKAALEIYSGSAGMEDDAQTMLGAGICHLELNNHAEALALLTRAREKSEEISEPDARIYYSLARALTRFERHEEASEFNKRALELDSTFVAAAQNLAVSAFRARDIEVAHGMVEQLITANIHDEKMLATIMSLALESGAAHLGLYYYERNKKKFSPHIDFVAAEVARYLKKPDRTVELCAKVARRDANHIGNYVVWVQALSDIGRFAQAEKITHRFLKVLQEKEAPPNVLPNPWATFALTDDAETQLKLAKRYADFHLNHLPRDRGRRRGGEARPVMHVVGREQPLKIGLLSPDFGLHPVAECLLPVFASKSDRPIEFQIFSVRDRADQMTKLVAGTVEKFHECFTMSYLDVKTLAQKEKIDVMLDLAVYTNGGRSNYFTLGLVERQGHFLGYSGPSGSAGYDFLVTDPFISPAGSEKYFSEELAVLSMPLISCSLRDTSHIPSMPREEYGLREGEFVFGCLAAYYKYNKVMLEAWAKILQNCPGSKLLLAAANSDVQARVRAFFKNYGVDGDRLAFARREDTRDQHISRLRMVDLFLDPYPYNAHSLAADYLSASVPFVSLVSSSFASRVGGSLLKEVGLDDLVTENVEEYVASAVNFWKASDRSVDVRSALQETVAKRAWGEEYRGALFELLRRVS